MQGKDRLSSLAMCGYLPTFTIQIHHSCASYTSPMDPMGMSPILAWLPRPQKRYSGRDSGRWRWKTKSRARTVDMCGLEPGAIYKWIEVVLGNTPDTPKMGPSHGYFWVSYQCEVRGLISMFSIQPVFVSPLFLCSVSSLQCMQKRVCRTRWHTISRVFRCPTLVFLWPSLNLQFKPIHLSNSSRWAWSLWRNLLT